mmetsp:Transcript_3461/g.9722  ORF Transcript_3461/g.9722 Transcript_3461/m.9722 type:complete len:167 (-) Transcript_3461:878-1378(-)
MVMMVMAWRWKGAGGRKVVGLKASSRRARSLVRGRADGGGGGNPDDEPAAEVLSEEMLERLKEAEKEAAELRKQLADMKEAEAEIAAASTSGRDAKPNRPDVKIDGSSTFTRENFLYPTSDTWLGGKAEACGASEIDPRVLTRRRISLLLSSAPLVIGLGGTRNGL